MACRGESTKRIHQPLASEEKMMLGSKEAREKDEDDSYEIFEICNYFDAVRGVHYRMCDDQNSRRRDLVQLYARLGLHRYNFLQGKHLQLVRVTKYINSTGRGCAAGSYSISLKAKDPETSGLPQRFQTRVDELSYGGFVLTCSIARPLREPRKKFSVKLSVLNNNLLGTCMPELPLESPFKGYTDRFYVLKESEIRDNDWIHLYLELAVATTNWHYIKLGLTNLKILKVAMEPFNEGFDAFDAIFYIRYKDSCNVDCVAIVRRMLDEHSGTLGLVGRSHSSQTIEPSNESAAMEAGSTSAQD